MVEEKWLDEKGTYGEACQSLSWDQVDMINDKLHLGVLTLVNQSGFTTISVFSWWTPVGLDEGGGHGLWMRGLQFEIREFNVTYDTYLHINMHSFSHLTLKR